MVNEFHVFGARHFVDFDTSLFDFQEWENADHLKWVL